LHPHVSALWDMRDWNDFLALTGIACNQTGSVGEVWAVHNFKSAVSLPNVGVSTKGIAQKCVCVTVWFVS